MDLPPVYSASPTPVNVLIVGESQQGKSTLIKRLTKYAGTPNNSIKIGTGNGACTKSVDVYTVTVAPKEYQLVDGDGNPIKDLGYEALRDLDDEEASVVEIPDEDCSPTTFNFVDTPGLNDSDGDDMMHMAQIVGRCSDLSHLNALVYVRAYHEPYSRSFRRFFDYLQRCLPNINRGFIIVHTRFSADAIENDINDEAQMRREAFRTTTGLTLEHFFLDNRPNADSPFAQLQSLNEASRFLQHLASQRANPSTALRLLKTSQMQNIDVHICNPLNELKFKLERERQAHSSISETFRYNGVFHQTEISRLKTRIATLNAQIQSLVNGPDVVLGTKGCAVDYTLGTLFSKRQLQLSAERLDFLADHDITSIEKTQGSGVKWISEMLKGNSWCATVSGASFRSLSATATFYTTSAIRNREVIEVLRNMSRELESGIVIHENAIKLNGAGEQYSESAAQIGQNLGKVDELLAKLAKEEFEIALWPLLRVFYCSRALLSRQQIRDFVRVYDEQVAELLPH